MRAVWREYADLNRGIRSAYELLKTRSDSFRYDGAELTSTDVDTMKKEADRLRDFLRFGANCRERHLCSSLLRQHRRLQDSQDPDNFPHPAN